MIGCECWIGIVSGGALLRLFGIVRRIIVVAMFSITAIIHFSFKDARSCLK